MAFSFNLVDEPFIPSLLRDGTSCELGLKGTLLQAPDIREIFDPSPLVTVSLHRLLLAILHRNFGPEDEEAWVQLWRAGKWDAVVLNRYFAQWHDRFDLFGKERPFYQLAGFAAKQSQSTGKLAHQSAAGNNPTLFDHSLDGSPVPLTPAESARLVIAQQSWGLAGLGGGELDGRRVNFVDAPCTRGVLLLVEGDSLFETLMLNLIPTSLQQDFPTTAEDVPAWESNRPPEMNEESPPRGYLDYLTWQSRMLCLCPEAAPGGGPQTREYFIAQGRKLPADFSLDPMKLYRPREKQGLLPVRLSEHRALWRESAALLQIQSGKGRSPRSFGLIAKLAGDGVLDRKYRYRLAAFGLGAVQAKIHFWRHERMPLPVVYLVDEDLVGRLEKALDLAERVGRELRSAARLLASLALAPDEGRTPDRAAVDSISESLAPGRLYWARLDVPFQSFFVRLAEADADQADDELIEWARLTGRTATEALQQASHGLDTSVRTLKATTRAEECLRQRLYSRGKKEGVLTPYLEAFEAVEKGGE